MLDVCPEAFYCSDGNHSYSAIPPALHYLPAYAALVSSSLSLVGAALNMIAYCAFKDLRKGTAQTIIAVLAMTDFIVALSCIFGASIQIIYGTTNNDLVSDKDCHNFDTLCQMQAFVTMWALGCSFTWTSVLALHFFLVTVCTHSTWPHKLMPLYNIVAWLIPLSYTLPMLLLGKLGYTPSDIWTCFVRPKLSDPKIQLDTLEMATVVCVFLGYACVLFIVLHKSRQLANSAKKVSKRMLTFLIVYFLLRMWDLAAIFNSFFASRTPNACSNEHIQIVAFTLNIFMAVADPGQGWANCILYIFLSPKLRKRMFVRPFQQVWMRFVKKTAQRRQKDIESSSLLGDTTSPLSAPASRQGGTTDGTYLSFPTEFTCSSQK